MQAVIKEGSGRHKRSLPLPDCVRQTAHAIFLRGRSCHNPQRIAADQ